MPTQHINRIDLHYGISGSGPPLLFIHGLGSSCQDWEKQLVFFSPDFTVLTIDLRGHGKSGKPPGPYSIKQFADDTACLLIDLNLGPVHCIGLSLGGTTGLQLALDHPQLIKTLTLVNTETDYTVRSLKERWQLLLRLTIIKLLGMRTMGRVLSRRLFPKPEQAALRRTFVKRMAANNRKAYLAALKAIVGWQATDRLGEINCPVLVIAALGDYTSVARKKAYIKKIKQAYLAVIPDSRHATPIDQPGLFNRTLMNFLARNQETGTSC